jgi:hypothetical protein
MRIRTAFIASTKVKSQIFKIISRMFPIKSFLIAFVLLRNNFCHGFFLFRLGVQTASFVILFWYSFFFFGSVIAFRRQTTGRTNEQTNERTNEGTNERTNERTNGRTNAGFSPLSLRGCKETLEIHFWAGIIPQF